MTEKMEIDGVDGGQSPAGKVKRKKKTKHSTQPNVSVDVEEYWFNTNELLTANSNVLADATNRSEERTEILNALRSTLSLIDDSLKTMTSISPVFGELIQSLTDLLSYKYVDKTILFNIARVLINLSDKSLIKLESRNYVTVVCFLLENCSAHHTEKTMMQFIKKLRKLTTFLQNDALKLACLIEKAKIMASLKVALQQIHFCVSDMGVEIIGSIVAIDEELVKEFHDYVKRELITCKKPDAVQFGKIYFRIWDNMSEEDRQYFEERYIQWLMDRAFTMGRREVSVRNLSLNLQGLLSGLHQSRKQAKFSKVVTTLYTPLIWKYLSSENNIHRSNAAEIFMDVYPLEKPGEGMKSYSKYLRKQHDEILNLLNDSCPFVRIIAIKGACANMQYFWVTFQNGSAEKIIEKFVTELVVDGSYSDVRKAVYQGLTQLLSCTEAHDLLKGVLPSLGGFIHDENQSVRQAFVGMLIKIKKMKCNIKYWRVVDIFNFALRLANDTPKNRELIVSLIFSSFFNEKITPDESYKRLCKFISINPTASRYLAMYSTDQLQFDEAVDLMCLILAKLRRSLDKTKQSVGDENKEPIDHTRAQGVSKSDQNVLTSIENIDDYEKEDSTSINRITSASTEDSELSRSMSIHEPRIAHGLIDFISMLWLIHGKTLQKEEHKEQLEKLYCHAEKCVPIILRHFKETHAFFGALNLAGMVPVSRLMPYTTIMGICISMLRRMTLDTPVNENHCIIHALCMWNRGADIIELIREWLDEGLRSEALNESLGVSRPRRGKRVQFPRGEAKPILGLRILDDLFGSPTDQKHIFSKNVEDLQSLLKLLSRIKILIERRIEKGSQISELLSDDFLIKCLSMYGNMMIMFNENKVDDFNFWKQFTDYLTWCNRIFVKGCEGCSNLDEQSTDTIVFDLMQIPLTQCVNVVALGKSTDDQLITFLKFSIAMLDSDYGIHFVDMSLHLVKQLILFARVHHAKNRHSEVMTMWFPDIMKKLLCLLTDKIYSKESLSRFIKNVGGLKRNLVYVYLLSLKLYPELTHSSPSYKIMHSFCQSLVNVVLFPITECETLNVDQNAKNMPFVGSMMAAIFMSQLELASALLFVLKTIIDRFTEKDGLMLLATTSLLYTFAFSRGKIPKSEVSKVVRVTFQKLEKIPVEEGCLAVVMNHEQTRNNDRTIIDVEETTESALKEIGQHILKKIAEELGGSLS